MNPECSDVAGYFEQVVLPLIEARFPHLLPEMSVLVAGSAGLGRHDQWSDLDSMIYLDDPLWLEQGGQLQLLLMHGLPAFSERSEPHCWFPGEPHRWHISGHPEVCVHPVSWLLDHHATEFLAGGDDPPWEAVSLEVLYALQHDLVLRDPTGVLARLRAATAEERFPDWLWRKRLIRALLDLKGEPLDFEKAVARGDILTAHLVLGPLLQRLLEITFLIEQHYYPWRKHLWHAFGQLELVPQMAPQFELLATAPEWPARAAALDVLLDQVADAIVARGVLAPEMLEDLHSAVDGAWDDPHWHDEAQRLGRIAQEAGYDLQDGWVWGLWRWA